jgi:VanZ family protein
VTGRIGRRWQRIGFYLACLLVAGLSLAPGAALPEISVGDKIEHVLAYAALGLLGVTTARRAPVFTILGLILFGIALELLQAFSPGRSPEIGDALADTIGVCLGAAAARGAALIAIDKLGRAARPCRARAGGGEAPRIPSPRAARSSSSSKRASCVSN